LVLYESNAVMEAGPDLLFLLFAYPEALLMERGHADTSAGRDVV
jgi:hypothetical protein